MSNLGKMSETDTVLLNTGVDAFQNLGMRTGFKVVIALINAGATLNQVKSYLEDETSK